MELTDALNHAVTMHLDIGPQSAELGAEGALLVLAGVRKAFEIDALVQCPSCLSKQGRARDAGLDLRLKNGRLHMRCHRGCSTTEIISAAFEAAQPKE